MTKERDPRTVTLKGVRLSFTDGIKEKQRPENSPDATPKYNFNIINVAGTKHFDENNAKIIAAMKAAGEKKWKNPGAYKDIAEDNPKRVTFKKGERFKNKEGKVYAGYEGNYAFSVSGPNGGQRRPLLKDRMKRDVEEKDIEDVFYGGATADVIVSFFGTEEGSRGIFATCELVRSRQEGERMGGGYHVTEDDLNELDDLEDDIDDLVEPSKPSATVDDLLG